MFSYRDIRNTEPLQKVDTFWIQVSPWKADKKWMKFLWDFPLGTGTDSVVLTDRGGASLRITCDEKKSHTILPNSFGVGQITIEDFYVLVYRSQGTSSIEEDAIAQEIFSDIYNANGVMLAKHMTSSEVNKLLDSSPNGLYFIRTGLSIQSRIQSR